MTFETEEYRAEHDPVSDGVGLIMSVLAGELGRTAHEPTTKLGRFRLSNFSHCGQQLLASSRL
jgi:hypothetical protein